MLISKSAVDKDGCIFIYTFKFYKRITREVIQKEILGVMNRFIWVVTRCVSRLVFWVTPLSYHGVVRQGDGV